MHKEGHVILAGLIWVESFNYMKYIIIIFICWFWNAYCFSVVRLIIKISITAVKIN
ncbi:hypothetical protein D1AOALGA4SA_2592 [Olavius algarvensis Delta 1 endosymbiont]|nr:hypothetical protein D1AOALGA4SA_2592 [Olavius algarvensis Delta 1 endosymbiont]